MLCLAAAWVLEPCTGRGELCGTTQPGLLGEAQVTGQPLWRTVVAWFGPQAWETMYFNSLSFKY